RGALRRGRRAEPDRRGSRRADRRASVSGRRNLGSFPLAPLEALFEAPAQRFACVQDCEVAGPPWREPHELDVIAAVAVAARVRLRFLERASPPSPAADAQESHLPCDSSGIASPSPWPA